MQPNEVLEFWFGFLDHEGGWDPLMAKRWSNGGEAFDAKIRETFKKVLELDHSKWPDDPHGRLALILLYDQFPRNIYQGSKTSYAYDEKALMLVLEGLDRGDDLLLHPIERKFFYRPLAHAEDFELQELSVSFYELLVEDAPEDQKPFFEGVLDDAYRHHVLIERFGRFPQRNLALSRETTSEENAYLTEHQGF